MVAIKRALKSGCWGALAFRRGCVSEGVDRGEDDGVKNDETESEPVLSG